MRNLSRLAIVVALATATSGCLTDARDIPGAVADNSPNPRTARGYRVECATRPALHNWLTGAFSTDCQPVLGPSAYGVVRAKG